jgi:hypothetical protein
MPAVKGDFASLQKFKKKLRELPTSVAHSVAQRAAPDLTLAARAAYAAGRSVYGEARPTGVNGNLLDLYRTGATLQTLRFNASGTIVRCVLGTKYAGFLIGKYGILPNGAIPVEWSAHLRRIVAEVAAAP